jgi:indole-3-glycerol phosphate synthase
VEVHTLAELDRVLALSSVELVGINNRNLEDFSVSLAVTCDLLEKRHQRLADRNILVVSESGLHTAHDLQAVAQAGARAVLVGESLIKEDSTQPPFKDENERMQKKFSALFTTKS